MDVYCIFHLIVLVYIIAFLYIATKVTTLRTNISTQFQELISQDISKNYYGKTFARPYIYRHFYRKQKQFNLTFL